MRRWSPQVYTIPEICYQQENTVFALKRGNHHDHAPKLREVRWDGCGHSHFRVREQNLWETKELLPPSNDSWLPVALFWEQIPPSLPYKPHYNWLIHHIWYLTSIQRVANYQHLWMWMCQNPRQYLLAEVWWNSGFCGELKLNFCALLTSPMSVESRACP